MSRFLSSIGDLFRRRVTLQSAQKILGKENIFPVQDVSFALEYLAFGSFKIPYSRQTCIECAKENESGEHEWRLVAKLGLPPCITRQLSPRVFCQSSVWENSKCPLVMDGSQPGYLLIDFKLFMRGATEPERVEALSAQKIYSRLRLSTVIESLISIERLSGVRYLYDSFYATSPINGMIYLAGAFDEKGLLVYTLREDALQKFGDESIGTIICRTPEFHDAM